MAQMCDVLFHQCESAYLHVNAWEGLQIRLRCCGACVLARSILLFLSGRVKLLPQPANMHFSDVGRSIAYTTLPSIRPLLVQRTRNIMVQLCV